MDCSSCIWAGGVIEEMANRLNAEFPGMIRFYQFAYTSSMTCADMLAFKSINNFTATPFEANLLLMASYGGFGMPTIAVAAGSNHALLFSTVNFLTTDSALITAEVRNFFATLSAGEVEPSPSVSAYPNPAGDFLSLALPLKTEATVKIEITDMQGRKVMDVFSGNVWPGLFERNIFTGGLPSGNYLLRCLINGEKTLQLISISRS
jgi:hypothetical protein